MTVLDFISAFPTTGYLGAIALLLVFVVVLLMRRRAAPADKQLRDAPEHIRSQRDILAMGAAVARFAAGRLGPEGPAQVARSLAGEFDLADALNDLADRLAHFSEADEPSERLFLAVAEKELDTVLSNTSLLRGYFAMDPEAQTVVASLAIVEASIVIALDLIGVSLLAPLPLTVIARGTPYEEPRFSPRPLNTTPELRHRALERARTLERGEQLVVDRLTIGWTSPDRGSRAPAVILFNPAAWLTPP